MVDRELAEILMELLDSAIMSQIDAYEPRLEIVCYDVETDIAKVCLKWKGKRMNIKLKIEEID